MQFLICLRILFYLLQPGWKSILSRWNTRECPKTDLSLLSRQSFARYWEAFLSLTLGLKLQHILNNHLSVKLCLWDLLQIFSGLAKKAIKYSSGFGHQVPNNITLFGFHVFMRTVSNDSHRKIYTIIITIAVVFIILLSVSSITFLWRMWKQGSSLREIQKGESFQLSFFVSFFLAHYWKQLFKLVFQLLQKPLRKKKKNQFLSVMYVQMYVECFWWPLKRDSNHLLQPHWNCS